MTRIALSIVLALYCMGGCEPCHNGAATGKERTSNSHPVVPAPGAIILGSIGIVIVGWLRTRKKL